MKKMTKLFKKAVLKTITYIQKLLLRSETVIAYDLYYYLAKKHFNLYFNVDLVEEAESESPLADMAARRHGRLVLKVVYKKSTVSDRGMISRMAESSFIQNILLDSKL